ncbi:hypothetical protein JTE90_028375 [Oedothorax gibbosus]|uniref:Uncharacterized protein n=1 Tax=Oedothorax gibbosus TaxID=931172 RepID=A0AAV6VCF5_9ARAC|nr:hypothetical protein JTE90_028375 [Oedothorax gibbosus]
MSSRGGRPSRNCSEDAGGVGDRSVDRHLHPFPLARAGAAVAAGVAHSELSPTLGAEPSFARYCIHCQFFAPENAGWRKIETILQWARAPSPSPSA